MSAMDNPGPRITFSRRQKGLIAFFLWWLSSCQYFAGGALLNGIRPTHAAVLIQSVSTARSEQDVLTLCGTWAVGAPGEVPPTNFRLAFSIPPSLEGTNLPVEVSARKASNECGDLKANVLVQVAPDEVGASRWRGLDDYLRQNDLLKEKQQAIVLLSPRANDLIFIPTRPRTYFVVKLLPSFFEAFKIVPSEIALLPYFVAVDAVLGPVEWIFYTAGRQHGQPYAPAWVVVTTLSIGMAIFGGLFYWARKRSKADS